MARTSSIYGHFIIWPSSVTLTFNLPEQMFKMALIWLYKFTYLFGINNEILIAHDWFSFSSDFIERNGKYKQI